MPVSEEFLNVFKNEGIKEITLLKYPKGSFFIELWKNGEVQISSMGYRDQPEKAQT